MGDWNENIKDDLLQLSVDLPKINASKGDKYSVVLKKLIDFICEKIEINEDFSDCLDCEDCDCGEITSLPQAIRCLKKMFKSIDADDICLNVKDIDGGASKYSQDLFGKYLKFQVSVDKDKGYASLQYDLNDLVRSIDKCNVLVSQRVTVYGTKNNSSRSIIQQSSAANAVINIGYEKFPANAEFLLRFRTPGGDVELRGYAALAAPYSHEGILPFDVYDYTARTEASDNCKVTLASWSEDINAKVSGNTAMIDAFKQFKIEGLDGQGVFALIGAMAAEVQSLCDQVDDLKSRLDACNCGETDSNCN